MDIAIEATRQVIDRRRMSPSWPSMASSLRSASVSTGETKNDATKATVFRSPPSSRGRRKPRMYASAACRWRWSENSSVTFTGIPAAIVSSITGRPASVPGILTKRLGRSIIPARRWASRALVCCVSAAIKRVHQHRRSSLAIDVPGPRSCSGPGRPATNRAAGQRQTPSPTPGAPPQPPADAPTLSSVPAGPGETIRRQVSCAGIERAMADRGIARSMTALWHAARIKPETSGLVARRLRFPSDVPAPMGRRYRQSRSRAVLKLTIESLSRNVVVSQ